jgi:N-methylhydantoinase A
VRTWSARGFDPDDVRYRLEMDMRYSNQLVTTAVVFEINRIYGVGDVLHVIRTFSDIYGRRYGEGSEAPEAGIRVQTIRVASFVEGDVVKFESLVATQPRVGRRRAPSAVRPWSESPT